MISLQAALNRTNPPSTSDSPSVIWNHFDLAIRLWTTASGLHNQPDTDTQERTHLPR
jgi:hypothetical protein